MTRWLPCPRCGDDSTYPGRPQGPRRCGHCNLYQAVVRTRHGHNEVRQGAPGCKRMEGRGAKRWGASRKQKGGRGRRRGSSRRRNTEIIVDGRSVKRKRRGK